MRRILGCAIVFCLALPFTASAQTSAAESRGFFSVYFGGQSGDGDSTQSGTFSVYDETGSFTAAQTFTGGFLFSVGGGARVWGNVGVGGAFTRVSDTQGASVTVTAPHPLLFDTPRTATADQDDLKHTEVGFHLQVLYFVPVSEKFELAIGAGPSFISVTHDFITSAGFAEVGPPYTSITVSDVTANEADKLVTGFNIGAEAAYYLTRNVGIGGFLRWTVAKADLTAANSTVEVDLGGPQFGAGVRIRF